MVAETHDLGGLLPGEPDEHEGDREADQISDQVEGIADNRDGSGDVAAYQLSRDKNERNDDHSD